jgi:hypothetical protein
VNNASVKIVNSSRESFSVLFTRKSGVRHHHFPHLHKPAFVPIVSKRTVRVGVLFYFVSPSPFIPLFAFLSLLDRHRLRWPYFRHLFSSATTVCIVTTLYSSRGICSKSSLLTFLCFVNLFRGKYMLDGYLTSVHLIPLVLVTQIACK